jgi:hypothetical protein
LSRRVKTRARKGGWEPQVEGQLKELAVSYEYEPDKLPYVTEHKYTPDFKVTLPNGSFFYLECKGYFNGQDKAKMLSVISQNPDVKIRMLFQKNNLTGKRKQSYTDWCDKYGIESAVGSFPKEWLI